MASTDSKVIYNEAKQNGAQGKYDLHFYFGLTIIILRGKGDHNTPTKTNKTPIVMELRGGDEMSMTLLLNPYESTDENLHVILVKDMLLINMTGCLTDVTLLVI